MHDSDLAVLARDIHVEYRAYEDQRPTLRRLVARGFRHRAYRSIQAVRGVTLDLHKGESLGLIGHNGSGKSTLLRTVAGLLPPTRGEVFASQTPVLLGVRAALQAELSGRRNIMLGCTALGMSRAEARDAIDRVTEFAGLEDFIDLPLRAYSSGMTARLSFAISTSVRPDILLIDEALSVGDGEFQEQSEARIQELLDDAGTVVLVSHSLPAIRRVCERVIWMREGEVVMDGPTGDVVDAYKEAVDQHRAGRRRHEPAAPTPSAPR